MRLLAMLLLIGLPAWAQSKVPFSIVQVSRNFDAQGKLLSESQFFLAVNRNGAIVSLDLDPASGGARQILDPANGRTIVIDPNNRSASVFGIAPRPPAAESACGNRFLNFRGATVTIGQPAGTIHAVQVKKTTVARPDGVTMEVYMAPLLDCQMLKTTMRMTSGETLETTSTRNLTLGDPDPSLFRIPPGYQVTKAPLPLPR